MNKNQLFFLILSLIGIYSCKKDSEEILPQYPVTYKSYLISEPEIKVYTKNGEITSSSLKNDIIQRFKIYLTDLENVKIDGKIEATYLAEDTVKLKINNIEEKQSRLIHEKNGIIYWEKQDISTMGVDLYSFFAKTNIQSLYYEEYNVPWTTGYKKAAKYKECFYVKKKNEGFEMPMFDYVYKTGVGQPTIKGINNEFNENYASLIGDSDTIIIQEYKIDMK